ncbi:MAG: peptidase, partial [Planctomycetota bacterium]|nr:peptidase [Planctomycetota bacterium]
PQGAFLRADVDGEHWLTWGVPGDTLDALTRSSDALVAEPPVEVPVRYADLDRLHLGGLLWPEAAARIAKTAYVTRESRGRGQVLLFLEGPNFRSWTWGTRRLLTNAVLYGPGLGTRWSTPW